MHRYMCKYICPPWWEEVIMCVYIDIYIYVYIYVRYKSTTGTCTCITDPHCRELDTGGMALKEASVLEWPTLKQSGLQNG